MFVSQLATTREAIIVRLLLAVQSHGEPFLLADLSCGLSLPVRLVRKGQHEQLRLVIYCAASRTEGHECVIHIQSRQDSIIAEYLAEPTEQRTCRCWLFAAGSQNPSTLNQPCNVF